MKPDWRPDGRWALGAYALWVALPAWWLTPWWVAGLLPCVAGLYGLLKERTPRGVLLGFLLLTALWLWWGKPVLAPADGLAFLVLLFAAKLLECQGVRDLRLTVVLGWLLMAVFCLFLRSVWLWPWLAGCVVSGLLLLARSVQSSWRWQAVRPGLAWVVLTLPLAWLSLAWWPAATGWNTGEAVRRTGLGDSLSLGSMSAVVRDPAPAFQVHFDHGPLPVPAERYWRADVLWLFDGWRWLAGRSFLPVRLQTELAAGPDERAYTVEPQGTAFPDSRRVALDWPRTASGAVTLADGQTLWSTTPDVLPYTVVSSSVRPVTGLPESDRLRALQLPPAGNAQAREWARRLRADSGSDALFLTRLLQFIHTAGFRYTLRPPPLSGDLIDRFWFGTRAGFCEHYAAALAFMARAAGIPARVVVGWQGGEWQPAVQRLVVRQADAHAWTEVWLEGAGWLRLDGTAVIAPDRIEQGLMASLSSAERDDMPGGGWHWQPDWGAPAWRYGWLPAGACLLWLGWQGVMVWRRRAVPDWPRLQQRLERLAARAGWPRQPGEGAHDWAQRLRQNARPRLADQVQAYADLLYCPPAGDAARRSRALWRTLGRERWRLWWNGRNA